MHEKSSCGVLTLPIELCQRLFWCPIKLRTVESKMIVLRAELFTVK